MYKCIYVKTVDDKTVTITKKDLEQALEAAYLDGINEGLRRRDTLTTTPSTPLNPCPYTPSPSTPNTPYWPNDFWWTHVTCQNDLPGQNKLTSNPCSASNYSTTNKVDEPVQLQINLDTCEIE